MLYCGLRPEETAALQGRHIDRKNKIMHIEQALNRDGRIGKTKSKAGKREIPIPNLLLKLLPKTDPFDFVFKSAQGRPLNHRIMFIMWHNFKREMNINAGCNVYRNKLIAPYPIAQDLVPYCYRHTFCTDLRDAEVPQSVISYLMGHENISTTNIYTHMTDEQMTRTVARMDAYHQKVGE
jgi:integrase